MKCRHPNEQSITVVRNGVDIEVPLAQRDGFGHRHRRPSQTWLARRDHLELDVTGSKAKEELDGALGLRSRLVRASCTIR